MNIKDIKELKTALQKLCSKGFWYYAKNIGMLLILLFFGVVAANPKIIIEPSEINELFTLDTLRSILLLIAAAIGFYQLAKSAAEDDRRKHDREAIEKYNDILDKRKEDDRIKHNNLVARRFEIGPRISNELKDLLIKLDADRAAIIEMHNGTNNMSDLPFIYGDMVYEEISPKVGFASDEFKNFNLAKLPFVSLHYNNKIWVGSVNDIAKEDSYFAAKLERVDSEYGAFVVLTGINGPIGFLTLFFKDATTHPCKEKIIAELNHSAQIISNLLDKVFKQF